MEQTRLGYAIYLRKSRADEEAEARGDGETLARHDRALREYAQRNHLPIVAVYREIVSGESIANRPEVQRLLADVAARKYFGVLCMEMTRLARGDAMDQAVISRTFKFSGTQIITPNKTYMPDDSTDEEFAEIQLFFGRVEYRTITKRLQTGRRLASAEGRYIASRAPYGYDRIRLPSGEWTLKPNPVEADVVRQIFDWYVSGDGSLRIATRLNQAGIPSKRGGIWHQATISKMLHNPLYIGRITWDKRVDTVVGIDEQGRKQHRRLANSQHTNVIGLHPAIIDEDVFDAVSSVKRSNKPPVRSDQSISNPLAGLVYCAECGAPLKGGAGSVSPYTGKRYPYRLKCPRIGCKTHGALLTIIEDAILEGLEAWVVTYKGRKPASPAKRRNADAIAVIERQIKQLHSQRDKLCDFLERGLYDEDTFIARSTALASQLAAAQQQLTELQQAQPPTDPESLIISVVDKIPDVIAAYRQSDDPTVKNALLRQVLDRVVYSKTKRCNNRENAADYMEITLYPSAYSYN